jgi:hypothetical protein
MYFTQNTRKKNGKSYVYSFIAKSYRENGKPKKKILVNLSHLPAHTISSIAASFKDKKDIVALSDISVEQSIDYGNIIVILEIMKRLKINYLFEKIYPENSSLACLIVL